MQVSGGLHGVGISVVNALSEQLDVTVWRKGLQYSQSFQQGAPVGVLHQQLAQPNDASKRGTELRFLFDKSIFSEKYVSIWGAIDAYALCLCGINWLTSASAIAVSSSMPRPFGPGSGRLHF